MVHDDIVKVYLLNQGAQGPSRVTKEVLLDSGLPRVLHKHLVTLNDAVGLVHGHHTDGLSKARPFASKALGQLPTDMRGANHDDNIDYDHVSILLKFKFMGVPTGEFIHNMRNEVKTVLGLLGETRAIDDDT